MIKEQVQQLKFKQKIAKVLKQKLPKKIQIVKADQKRTCKIQTRKSLGLGLDLLVQNHLLLENSKKLQKIYQKKCLKKKLLEIRPVSSESENAGAAPSRTSAKKAHANFDGTPFEFSHARESAHFSLQRFLSYTFL